MKVMLYAYFCEFSFGLSTIFAVFKGVVGVNKARVKENCFFIIESWEKKYYEKNMTL